MSVQIILDSTADLRPGLKEQFLTVPLTVHFGTREYIDGVTLTHRAFYEKLVTADTLPSTSQATPAAFEALCREVTERGDTAVILTLASRLSGTWQSAMIAAEDFPGKIFVVDSTSVAIGSGILAELALSLRDQGLSAREIAAALEEAKGRVRVFALLDTLEYLKRGGRISAATAIAGGLLSIKPVAEVRDGQIRMLGKARGGRQGRAMLARQALAENRDPRLPILLGYTGTSEAAMEEFIRENPGLWTGGTPEYVTIGSVVGTHAGPGAVAIAFFARED